MRTRQILPHSSDGVDAKQDASRVPTPRAEPADWHTDRISGGSARRARLVDLDPHIHCSVIGTCLSSAELRDLVGRFAGSEFCRATDFEVHHCAVQIAAEGGPGSEALHEVLDHRYDADIGYFESARNEDDLRQLWGAARRSGEIAGAYWAAMTHSRATFEFRQRIFGEVHGIRYVVTDASDSMFAAG